MSTLADSEFRRFLEDGRPERIGRVFDDVAPELFRMAVHLSGDIHVAEDLVQATFLTLLEKLDGYDRQRALVPWLCGILALHARERVRKDGRELDVERYLAMRERKQVWTHGDEPSLSAAIEQIEEPYRQTLLLRFVHGLEPAAIARVLGRSPGTVRVQIHRGIAMVRALLPRGERAHPASLAVMFATEGLGRIRDVILSKAATMSVASSTAVLIGGLVMTKKILAAAAAAAVVIGAIWTSTRIIDEDETRLDESSASVAVADVVEPRREAASEPTGAEPPTIDSTPKSVAVSEAKGRKIRGRVFDAATSTPLGGVRVRVFRARLGRYDALRSKWPGRSVHLASGGSSGAWPIVLDQLGDLERTGRRKVRILDRECADAPPIAESTTDENGNFRLATDVESEALLIVCSHDGYATQDRVMTLTDEYTEFRLSNSWRLEGRLIGLDGEPIAEPVLLQFDHTVPRDDRISSPPTSWIVGMDVAIVGEGGSFNAAIGTEAASVRLLSPGWCLVHVGPVEETERVLDVLRRAKADGHLQSSSSMAIARRDVAGTDIGRIDIVVIPAARLRVKDAVTRAPIERFSVISRESRSRYPWTLMGDVTAPRGELGLVRGDETFLGPGTSVPGWTSGIEFTVWAPGYRETTIVAPSLSRAPDVLVLLGPGEVEILEGHILADGSPVEGVEASLSVVGPLQWSDNSRGLLDAERTSKDGAFRFAVPKGIYHLRIAVGTYVHARTVDVPTGRPLDIDIERQGRIEVTIRDERRRPLAAHVVALQADDGRSQRGKTIADGTTVFEDLPPGEFSIMIPYVSTDGSFAPDEFKSVRVAEGESQRVEFLIPVLEGERHARLVTRPPAALESFTAHRLWGGDVSPRSVEPDGRIPFDIGFGGIDLEIRSSSGGIWRRNVPKKAPDGYEIVIELDGRGYAGVIVDASSGEPIKRARIEARTASVHGAGSTHTVTDEQGRFRIVGLPEAAQELVIELQSIPGSGASSGATSYHGVVFLPSAFPADPPAESLRILLPSGVDRPGKADRRTIHGHVEARGSTLDGARVALVSLDEQAGGVLRTQLTGGFVTTGEKGAFVLEVLASKKHRLTVFGGSPPRLLIEKEVDLTTHPADEPFVIVID